MIPSVDRLTELGFEEPQAVHLYLYALSYQLNTKFVKVSNRDKALLVKLNIVSSQVLDDGLLVEINLEDSNKVIYKTDTIEGQVDLNIEDYRAIFKNTKPGSMGSKNIVRQNLIDFLYRYTQYNMQDIINAAKRYKESLENYRYMRQADYFIFKQQYPGSPKTSTLLEVLENPDAFKPISEQWQKLI